MMLYSDYTFFTEDFNCEMGYRCKYQGHCVMLNEVCDGVKNCPNGDDELFCNVTCPSACTCDGLSAQCTNASMVYVPKSLSVDIRLLDLSGNNIEYISEDEFENITQLVHLNIGRNMISNISSNAFACLNNLLYLDLSYNELVYLRENTFYGLYNLKSLVLLGNKKLKYLESGVFSGLRALPRLDLHGLSLDSIVAETFVGLQKLTYLNLSMNNAKRVLPNAFKGIGDLNVLDISTNEIVDFSPDIFKDLSSLSFLKSDSYVFCCLKPSGVSEDNCLPKEDAFSSCEDLMRNDVLRTILWVFGIMSFIGNAFVLTWRLHTRKSSKHSTNRFLVSNLAASDIVMGIYLLSIASVDASYRGRYIWNEFQWRNSGFCQFLGMIATISSQGSVLILCLISVDRFICICFPFSDFKLTIKRCRVCVAFVWFVIIIFAALPLLPIEYFNGFYAENGVCLALPLAPRSRMTGIDYSLALFVYINLLALILIAICYVSIYIVSSRSGRSFAKRTRNSEMALARKLTMVVVTDFACWFPIIVMGKKENLHDILSEFFS